MARQLNQVGLVVLILFPILPTGDLSAQSQEPGVCSFSESNNPIKTVETGNYLQSSGWPALQSYFPIQGSVNALFIFVQFADDNSENCQKVEGFTALGEPSSPYVEYNPSCVGRNKDLDSYTVGSYFSSTDHPTQEWPSNLGTGPIAGRTRQLPSWAANGFVDHPDANSFTQNSITDLYNRVSNGKFQIKGMVWPATYITQLPQAAYHPNRNGYNTGMDHVAAEIIGFVNSNPLGIPVGDATIWDKFTNGSSSINSAPDGIVDLIVLVFRNRDNKVLMPDDIYIGGNAVASLGWPQMTNWANGNPPVLGGLSIMPGLGFYLGSGVSVQGYSKEGVALITMHEIGHNQMGLGHTMEYYTEDNNTYLQKDLPSNNAKSIMVPSLRYNMGFGATDRLLLGWANVNYLTKNSLQPWYYTDGYPYSLTSAYSTDFFSADVIVFRAITGVNSPGDIVLEARKYDTMLDAKETPTSTGIAQEGIFVYKISDKISEPSTATRLRFAGDIPHSNGVARRAFHGINEQDGVGVLDAFTPITRMSKQIGFIASEHDALFAITDVTSVANGFSFKIWKDFLKSSNVNKPITRYTDFTKTAIMWVQKYDWQIPNPVTWSVGGHFIVQNPVLLENGILQTGSPAGWQGITLNNQNVRLSNMQLKNLTGGAGGAGITLLKTAKIHDSRIETNTSSNGFTGILASGLYASGVEIANTTVISRSGPAIRSANGAYVSLYQSKIESTTTTYPVIETSSNSMLATWLAAYVYRGLNEIKGGNRSLKAIGSGSYINAGEANGSKDGNQFCTGVTPVIEVANGGTIYARFNYWPSVNGPSLVNNGGAIFAESTTHSGLSSCSGVFKSIDELVLENTKPENASSKKSLDGEVLKILSSDPSRRQQWLESESAEFLLHFRSDHAKALIGINRIKASLGAPNDTYMVQLERETDRQDLIKSELVQLLASYWIAEGSPDRASLYLGKLEALDRGRETEMLKEHFASAFGKPYVAFAGNPPHPIQRKRVTENKESTKVIVYPNPFNPTTTIKINSEKVQPIKIDVFDINGRQVTTLFNGTVEPGIFTQSFTAKNLSSGMYLIKILTDSGVQSIPIELIK